MPWLWTVKGSAYASAVERIVDLCGRCIDGLRDEAVLGAADNPAMAERVAGIIQERATSLLQDLK